MENQMKKPHDYSANVIPPDNQRCNSKNKRRSNLGPSHDSSDDEIQFKKQRVETTEKTSDHQVKKWRELEEETKKSKDKLEKILWVCKKRCLELLADLDQKALECIGIQGKIDELESMKIAAEDELKRSQERRRNLDGMGWGKKEERTSGRISYLEGELKRLEKDMEHEKGEVQFWRNKFFDSEVRVLRMENGSVESRIYLPNDAPHSGETVGDNELSQQGRHCSRVSEFQTKGKVLNKDEVVMNAHRQVKEQVLGCPDMSIPSGSPNLSCGGQKAEDVNCRRVERRSLEFSKNLSGTVGNTAAVNSVALVCSDNDDECDSESLGEVMDRMAKNDRNKVKEVKWEIEADMLASFGKDPELCMKAVCALYRHQSFKGKSANGFVRYFDAMRIKNLADFLMDGNCKGDLKKSVKELEQELTPDAVEDCKRLASSYLKQLFTIYKGKQDPFFVPSSTGSC